VDTVKQLQTDAIGSGTQQPGKEQTDVLIANAITV